MGTTFFVIYRMHNNIKRVPRQRVSYFPILLYAEGEVNNNLILYIKEINSMLSETWLYLKSFKNCDSGGCIISYKLVVDGTKVTFLGI